MSSIPRFFIPPAAIHGDHVTLPPDVAHHAASVLRLHEGEAITIHDGTGAGYACRLIQITSKNAIAVIEQRYTVPTEPRTRITVAQALPKTSEKIEQVLQHGTEVGAAGFVLFQAERSVARMDQKDKIEKRLERWRGIVQGAAEQSGRGVLPTVDWIARTADLVRQVREWDGTVLALHERATLPLREAIGADTPTASNNILVIVGPEGGISEGEIQTLTSAGAFPILLGPRILRTETAALVALAQILYANSE